MLQNVASKIYFKDLSDCTVFGEGFSSLTSKVTSLNLTFYIKRIWHSKYSVLNSFLGDGASRFVYLSG